MTSGLGRKHKWNMRERQITRVSRLSLLLRRVRNRNIHHSPHTEFADTFIIMGRSPITICFLNENNSGPNRTSATEWAQDRRVIWIIALAAHVGIELDRKCN
jgi:hypothetical protein